MELREVSNKKGVAEKAIANILSELEAETGCLVRELEIGRSGIVRGFNEPPIVGTKITLEVK